MLSYKVVSRAGERVHVDAPDSALEHAVADQAREHHNIGEFVRKCRENGAQRSNNGGDYRETPARTAQKQAPRDCIMAETTGLPLGTTPETVLRPCRGQPRNPGANHSETRHVRRARHPGGRRQCHRIFALEPPAFRPGREARSGIDIRKWSPIYKDVRYRGYTYALRPTAEQTTLKAQFAGVCRLVWNLALEQRRDHWRLYRERDSHLDCRAALKSKYGTTPSFTIPDNVRIDGDRIAIPRIGTMRIRRKHPYPDGRPVQAVIRKEAGKWYVTVCYAVEAEERPDTGTAAGMDMNVGQVAVATSAGEAEIISAPETGDLDAKIGRNQRRLVRQRKGSRRRMRTKLPPAEAPAEAGEQAPELAAPGEPPDRQPGWHGMKAKLAYKTGVVEVNPAYTSQTCNACGAVDKASRRTQLDFTCVACGHADNADLNAARNILTSGTGASARRGALALATPATRETDRKLAA